MAHYPLSPWSSSGLCPMASPCWNPIAFQDGSQSRPGLDLSSAWVHLVQRKHCGPSVLRPGGIWACRPMSCSRDLPDSTDRAPISPTPAFTLPRSICLVTGPGTELPRPLGSPLPRCGRGSGSSGHPTLQRLSLKTLLTIASHLCFLHPRSLPCGF